MKSVEFNAGAVFDNLTCSYCQDEMIAIKCIMKAIKTQKLLFVFLEKAEEEEGYALDQIIEFDGMEKLAVEQEKQVVQVNTNDDKNKNEKKDKKTDKKE